MLELEILHTFEGDRKKKIDTTTEKGRKEAQATIKKLMARGTALFVTRGKETYRVKDYDPRHDALLVEFLGKGKRMIVTAKGQKSRVTAVAPQAGG